MATQIALVVASSGTVPEKIEELTNARVAELEAEFRIIEPPITVTTNANGETIVCITYKDANG